MKLTFREKYSYGIGAFGKDLVYAFVATYLMMFFTDEVGISSVFVGGLFFVSRFWDAINDPIMGKIVDNTNTKWGKFRPWLLIGTLINAVVLIFLFINPESIISIHSMLMDIQSIQLLLIRDAETENFINDLEHDKHGHAGPEENGADTGEL